MLKHCYGGTRFVDAILSAQQRSNGEIRTHNYCLRASLQPTQPR